MPLSRSIEDLTPNSGTPCMHCNAVRMSIMKAPGRLISGIIRGGASRPVQHRPTTSEDQHERLNMPSDGALPPPAPRSAITSQSSWRAIGPLLSLVAIVNLAFSLYSLPVIRVIERRLCRDHWAYHDPSLIGPGGQVAEKHCKVNAIQQDLGYYQGVMETFWITGDFLVTLPVVSLVRKYGPGPILCLNLVPRAILLAAAWLVGSFDSIFPAKFFLIAPIFSFLGGECVFNSITYALVAASTDDATTRATYFSQMSAMTSIFASQLGPALASASMEVSIWLPFFIGLLLLLAAVPLLGMLPKVRPSRSGADGSPERSSLLPSLPTTEGGLSRTPRTSVLHTIRELPMAHSRNFVVLLLTCLLASLASSDTKLLPQYISKRYEWRLVSVGYLLSAKALFNFFYLTLILPKLLTAGHDPSNKQSDASGTINVRRAVICLGFSVLGALAIGFSPTILILTLSLFLYALGAALPIFTYSLLKSDDVLPDQLRGSSNQSDFDSQAFSIVMLVKTLGSLIGAPLMATLWVRGIGIGGSGLGIPYMTSALCYALAMYTIRQLEFGRRGVQFPS